MVVAGELLEDGDADLELPDQPPTLSPDELFNVEAKSIEKEIKRLVEMGVLVSAEGANLDNAEKLTTRFVLDWRRKTTNGEDEQDWLLETMHGSTQTGLTLLHLLEAKVFCG